MLAKLRRPADVTYHSVIGVTPPTGPFKVADLLAGIGKNEPGDGVVPYSGAHVEPVKSELVVPAEHTEVHHHPLSVQEMPAQGLGALRGSGEMRGFPLSDAAQQRGGEGRFCEAFHSGKRLPAGGEGGRHPVVGLDRLSRLGAPQALPTEL